MNSYVLSLYDPGSKATISKWLYASLEKAIELASYWEQHKNASEFDWKISFNGEIVFEMVHNPT